MGCTPCTGGFIDSGYDFNYSFVDWGDDSKCRTFLYQYSPYFDDWNWSMNFFRKDEAIPSGSGTVNHDIFLRKLYLYGVQDSNLKCFESKLNQSKRLLCSRFRKAPF